MVSNITEADIKELVIISKEMHQESSFKTKVFSPLKLMSFFINVIQKPKIYCGFVYKVEGKIVGMFVGAMQEYFFNHDRHALDLLLYVSPLHRGSHIAVKLLSEYEQWAKRNLVKEIGISQSTGVEIERTTKFLEKLGYSQRGSVMKKDI